MQYTMYCKSAENVEQNVKKNISIDQSLYI